MTNEAHKKRVKAQYDKSVHPCIYNEGDLVLLYDQDKDELRASKFVSMWMGPYIVRNFLGKGAYKLEDFKGNALK